MRYFLLWEQQEKWYCLKWRPCLWVHSGQHSSLAWLGSFPLSLLEMSLIYFWDSAPFFPIWALQNTMHITGQTAVFGGQKADWRTAVALMMAFDGLSSTMTSTLLAFHSFCSISNLMHFCHHMFHFKVGKKRKRIPFSLSSSFCCLC